MLYENLMINTAAVSCLQTLSKFKFCSPSNNNKVILDIKVLHGQVDTAHRSHSSFVTRTPITDQLHLGVSPRPFLELLLIGRIHLDAITKKLYNIRLFKAKYCTDE